jgi:hypothetical protein
LRRELLLVVAAGSSVPSAAEKLAHTYYENETYWKGLVGPAMVLLLYGQEVYAAAATVVVCP